MFHSVDSLHPSALHLSNPCLSLNADMSADLSCADVIEGGELQQEVVVREGDLGVGCAAVVTCGWGEENTSARPLLAATSAVAGDVTCTHMSSGAERVPSPRSSGSLPSLQGQTDMFFVRDPLQPLAFFFMQQLKQRASGLGVTNAHNETRWLTQCDQRKSAQR